MKNKALFFFLSFLVFGQGFSQIPNDYGYEEYKKKFPKESYVFLDLETTDVFDITKNGLEINSLIDEEILYLNKNAYNLSHRGLYYDQFTELMEVEAYCYNPSNGKYKKEKVKDFQEKDVIAEGISFYNGAKNKKFQFPNLKEGSVSKLMYTTKTLDYHLLFQRSFYMSSYAKKETKRFKVHKDIELGFQLFHMENSGVEYSEEKKGDYTIYTWEILNKEEQNIYGDEEYDMYYTPHIVPYIKSFTVNGNETVVFRSLDDLYNWYYSLVKQVNPSEKKELKLLADSLTQGIDSEIEKVKRIYYWVQNQIKYIAFGDGYGGFVPRDPDLIYERRFGDCKDMSCLTINLLKELDIPAYFTWVGTRQIPYGYSELFTPQVDNHMIATYVDENGEKLFLDATDSYLEFGRPSSMIQGKEVLISLGENKYLLEDVPVLPAEVNSELDVVQLTIEGETLKGVGEALFTGYYAAEVYRDFKDDNETELIASFKRRLSKGTNKFIPSDITFAKVNNSKDSLKVTYSFKIDNYLKKIGGNIYLDLNLSKQLKDLKLPEKQNVPLILDYKWQLTKQFELEIPENYTLQFVPENKSFSNELMEYRISYKEKEGKLNYELFYQLKTVLLEVDQLEEWDKTIKKLSNDIDESLKLIKN